MGTGELNVGGNLVIDYPIRGRENTVEVASSCWDKLQSDGLLNLYADFNLYLLLIGQGSRMVVSVTIQEPKNAKPKEMLILFSHSSESHSSTNFLY